VQNKALKQKHTEPNTKHAPAQSLNIAQHSAIHQSKCAALHEACQHEVKAAPAKCQSEAWMYDSLREINKCEPLNIARLSRAEDQRGKTDHLDTHDAHDAKRKLTKMPQIARW